MAETAMLLKQSSPTVTRKTRRICFVTGTRAEFGLMRTVLRAIKEHPSLRLQIVVTGMHLDARHGRSVDAIGADGWSIDAVVPWARGDDPASVAAATGKATAGIARALDRLNADVVLVVGDRVEAFAAATAGHLSRRIVAHVHGGDRALGQTDDALRHAITKLAHVHFPATAGSAERIERLGEDPWRIHRVGAPGIDGIRDAAMPWSELRRQFPTLARRRYALLVLHPASHDDELEARRADDVLAATLASGFSPAVVIAPNNDPGAGGILGRWDRIDPRDPVIFRRDVPRGVFLGLLREAGVLVGNSSAGIIEAASFGTPVVNVGPRQDGRERGGNVVDVPYNRAAIGRELRRVWNDGSPIRFRGPNVYGGAGTGRRIARVLASLPPGTDRLLRKLIRY